MEQKFLRACDKINLTDSRAGFSPEFKTHPQVHSKIELCSKDATQKSGKKTSENVKFISSQALCPLIDKFKIAKFELIIQAKEQLSLPEYKGSTLRGGFGITFKKVVCVDRKKECNECLLKEKCVYAYIFETPSPTNTSIMRKYEHIPHPFVIEPTDNTKKHYEPGEELSFNLILIGKAIDYLPYFIYTFDEMGKVGIGKGRGKFNLKEVRSEELYNKSEVRSQESEVRSEEKAEIRNWKAEDRGHVIYSGDDKILKNNFKQITIKDIPHPANLDSLALNFITPTRIVYDKKLTIDLEFHIFIRNLLRRITNLAYFHCDYDTSDIDFKGIISNAEKIKTSSKNLTWHDWERYSARQDTRMNMGGFKGEISFAGDMAQFIPLIMLGEQVHVGKGTSFGLGKYSIQNSIFKIQNNKRRFKIQDKRIKRKSKIMHDSIFKLE